MNTDLCICERGTGHRESCPYFAAPSAGPLPSGPPRYSHPEYEETRPLVAEAVASADLDEASGEGARTVMLAPTCGDRLTAAIACQRAPNHDGEQHRWQDGETVATWGRVDRAPAVSSPGAAPRCPLCGGELDPCKDGAWMCNDTLCYAFGELQRPARGGADEAPSVTDDDVRRAVCAYNEWDYAEMGKFVHLLDSRSRSVRRVIEGFVARRLTTGETAP